MLSETKMKATKGLLAAAVLSLLATGCAYNGPDRVAVGVGPGYYDGFYDDYYGPFYDGYWGDDGYFWYSDANRNWHRDVDHHFSRTAANRFYAVHGSGIHREH